MKQIRASAAPTTTYPPQTTLKKTTSVGVATNTRMMRPANMPWLSTNTPSVTKARARLLGRSSRVVPAGDDRLGHAAPDQAVQEDEQSRELPVRQLVALYFQCQNDHHALGLGLGVSNHYEEEGRVTSGTVITSLGLVAHSVWPLVMEMAATATPP